MLILVTDLLGDATASPILPSRDIDLLESILLFEF